MSELEQQPLTAERARELLDYDGDTGVLTWKTYRCGLAQAGFTAGTINCFGYRKIVIDRKQYLAHRLAWLISHGDWPEHEIDHINGERDDNRLCNLRDIPRHHNQQNQTKPQASNKKSQYLGVCWLESRKKWQASIWAKGKTKFLGHYDCEHAAHHAYVAAKRRLHPGGML